MNRRKWQAIGAVLLAFTLIGCGGGDDDDAGGESSGGDGTELSREDYIAAADDVCREAAERQNDLPEPESEDELADLMDDAIDIVEEAQDDFEALTPPEEAEEIHGELLEALEGSLDKAGEAQDALAEGDMDAVQTALEEADEIGTSADDAAKEFGFEVCGSEDEL